MTGPMRRRSFPRLAAVAAVAAVTVLGGGSAPADAGGLVWTVGWAAPISATAPNPVGPGVELAGTIDPPLGQVPSATAHVPLPDGYPATCTPTPGGVAIAGKTFTVAPGLGCNGTYLISIATKGRLLGVPANGPGLRAELVRADPGPAPAPPSATTDGRARITLHFTPMNGADIVGHRVLRNDAPVADLGPGDRQFVDTVPGDGTYRYAIQVLRWGAGGPGSLAVASAPSGEVTTTVAAGRPTVPNRPGNSGGTGGSGGSTGPGGSGGTGGTGGASPGGGGTGGGGAPLPVPSKASPTLPTRSSGGTGSSGSRRTYRSGGVVSTPTTGPETFAERLPYTPKEVGRTVTAKTPDRTRTFTEEIPVRERTGRGLIVPVAVVLVAAAAAVQLRALLHRARPGPAPIDIEPAA